MRLLEFNVYNIFNRSLESKRDVGNQRLQSNFSICVIRITYYITSKRQISSHGLRGAKKY